MEQLLPFVLIIFVFYFLLIRPQQRRTKQHQQLISDIQVGDEITTIGGMFGKVTRQDDASVWIQVDDGVEIRMAKQAINRKIVPEDQEPPSATEGGGESETENPPD